MITGIDVSSYQSVIDWQRVKAAGIGFCMVKLTEGVRSINQLAHAQAVDAQEHGIKVGYYHFGHPESAQGAQSEAAFFLERIRRSDIPTADIIPAIDVEQYSLNGKPVAVPHLEQWIKDFCGSLQTGGLDRVMVYSNPSYLDSYLGKSHTLGNMPLWLSEYSPTLSVKPHGWADWAIWQNSGNGHVDGIKGAVDTNFCRDLTPLLLNHTV